MHRELNKIHLSHGHMKLLICIENPVSLAIVSTTGVAPLTHLPLQRRGGGGGVRQALISQVVTAQNGY